MDGDYSNLITSNNTKPYTEMESENFTIDYSLLEQYIGFFHGCDILIADPGAEIDLLAITGRFDLIKEYINFLRKKFKIVITSVHHAGITIPLFEENNIDYDWLEWLGMVRNDWEVNGNPLDISNFHIC